MLVHTLTFNPFQENTYVLADSTGECIIIDPGCYGNEEQKRLSSFIHDHGLRPVRLLNTHAHLDHMLGNGFVHRTWQLLPELHALDLELLRAAPLYGDVWGIRAEPSPDPVRFLEEGEVVRFGNSSLEVLFVPGHCPGHIAFYDPKEGILIGGDVLFQGSIGRTDLPGGDLDTLLDSIRKKLFALPDGTVVYPGHGPATTIGEERAGNPFLLG
jgi:hydroxyacylglutathione hydrolase